MVDVSWGQKHFCLPCRTRFYDMGRHPVVCPRCTKRIDSAGNGAVRRSPAASELEAVSVLAEVDPSGIAEAPVPVDLAADEDVLESVAIDNDSREIGDTDQEDEDGADDDRIGDSDEFELDDDKDGVLDDDEDSPVEEDDDDPEAAGEPDSVEDGDETEDDGELEEDEGLGVELVGNDRDNFNSEGDVGPDQDDGDVEAGLNPGA